MLGGELAVLFTWCGQGRAEAFLESVSPETRAALDEEELFDEFGDVDG